MRRHIRKIALGLIVLTMTIDTDERLVGAPLPETAFPQEVIDAWENAGASFGYMRPGEEARLVFSSDKSPAPNGELPALIFHKWKSGLIQTLPAPPVPFALAIRHQAFRNADLDELAPFRKIAMLSLAGTRVSDQGLKELAKMEHLHTLDLSLTSIANEGLKQLASIPNLQHLYLSNTAVSDAGIINLREIRHLRTLDLGGLDELTDRGIKDLCVHQELRFVFVESKTYRRWVAPISENTPPAPLGHWCYACY